MSCRQCCCLRSRGNPAWKYVENRWQRHRLYSRGPPTSIPNLRTCRNKVFVSRCKSYFIVVYKLINKVILLHREYESWVSSKIDLKVFNWHLLTNLRGVRSHMVFCIHIFIPRSEDSCCSIVMHLWLKSLARQYLFLVAILPSHL